MKNPVVKKLLPHAVALLLFIITSFIYCKPAFEGKVLNQHDITHWKGAIQNSVDYSKTHDGKYPLWTNSVFSGMPAFQIGGNSGWNISGYVHKIMTLNLPEPIQFFFLACICFYFLCLVLRINPYVAIAGAIGFAYATYNPVIISVGHATKMWSIAYMPALLASIILIYEKKYWIGAALTAIFSCTLIAMNHLQIDYYFFIMAAIMTAFYLYRWIQNKEWKHIAFALPVTVLAALTGVLTNSTGLLSTYEYQKETIRGGSSALTDTTRKITKSTTGLDKDYAFSYSMGITEPLVMLLPRMYGGSSGYPTLVGGEGFKEMNEDKSKVVEALQTIPREVAQQLAGSTTLYWGGIKNTGGEPSTSGPPYAGAIICFLAIISFFVLDKKHKWWALTAILVAIFLSWGSNFKTLNYFLFDNLPFYNKFRAPSMIMVIPQLLLPFLAVLGLNAYVTATDKKLLWPKLKKGLLATGITFVILFLLYLSFGFLTASDSSIMRQVRATNNSQFIEAAKTYFDALKADRKGLMLGDIFRALGFIAITALALYLLVKKKIKPMIAISVIILFVFIDLISIDSKYLNKDDYREKTENVNVFQKSKADEAILADTSYYRVLNMAGDRFNENITSYLYHSAAGYHAAKLIIYQDLIERQLSKPSLNMPVINMLNVKYLIERETDPSSMQYGQTKNYQKNPGALGPCWFVKNIIFVKDADQEMASLDQFNPADTAFVQEKYKPGIPFMPVADSTATIRLIKNDNDIITYSANAASIQFAVFSEIYYDKGWVATIDGKETPIVKVNYVLRGLAIPPGQHTIVFEFRPRGYYTGKKISSIANLVLGLLVVAAAAATWISKRKRPK